ncbi:hypothetical protein [Paraburkholderia aromaticivorans]|uniref:hypothetical protein n=1 Tax=Paraburkholderia aromaticivorans TaxID=2026199 RepID=UPI0038B6EB78
MRIASLTQSFLSGGHDMPSRDKAETNGQSWVDALQRAADQCISNEKHRENCLTSWVTHGGRIREEIDDDELLVRLLRAVLPTYKGPSLTVYRGESEERFSAGRIGLCWSSQRHTAEMFGRGLNAYYPGGGILLSASAEAKAILSGPGKHSRRLGEEEYTIDPSALTELMLLQRYPNPDDHAQQ